MAASVPEESAGAGEPQARAEDAEEAWRALRDGFGAAAARQHDGEMRCIELCPICRTADFLRASGPPEIRGQIDGLQREALIALRALLDGYLERLDRSSAADRESTVEEIPID